MHAGWTYVESNSWGITAFGIRKWFNLDQQSIKLAVNPASNLTIEEAYFQLNVHDHDRKPITASSGGTIINNELWTSGLAPLACSEDYAIIIDEISQGLFYPDVSIDDLSVSLVLVFKNNEGDKFLHKSTWEAEYEEIIYPYNYDERISMYNNTHQNLYNWFNKPPYEGKNNGFFNASQNLIISTATIDQDVSAYETITVDNSTITATAQHPVNPGFTNIIAGHTIDILPGSEILPNSDLEINRLGRSCDAPLTLATAAEINTICNSNEYQAQKIQAKMGLGYGQEALQYSDFNFITYPNPANDFVKIALSENFSEVNEIEALVTDITGRVVKVEDRLTKTGNHFVLETAQLCSGMYLIEIKSGDQKSVKRIFID